MFRFLLLGVAFLASAAQAEPQCARKLSSAERLYCAAEGVGESHCCDEEREDFKRLDGKLNKAYAEALRVAPSPAILKDDQRAWLRDFSQECERDIKQNSRCDFEGLYSRRIAKLNELKRNPGLAIEEKKTRDICSELLKLGDERRIARLKIKGKRFSEKDEAKMHGRINRENWPVVYSIYKIPFSLRGPPGTFAVVAEGGTCHSDPIVNYDKFNGQWGSDRVEVNDTDDNIRWAYFGGGDYPIKYRGHYYIVTSSLEDDNSIEMLSLVRPDGRIQPMCLAEGASQRYVVTSAKDKALCSAIADESLKPMKWKDMTAGIEADIANKIHASSGRVSSPGNTLSRGRKQKTDAETGSKVTEIVRNRYGIGGVRPEVIEILDADIDSDGVTERIGRFDYASGAGCGSAYNWIRPLSRDLTYVVKGKLNDLLGDFDMRRVEIYEHNRNYYLRVQKRDVARIDEVFSLRGGRAVQVCELERKPHSVPSEIFHAVKP